MRKDITNMKFGNLLAVEYLGSFSVGKKGATRGKWKCLCDCGSASDAFTGDLTSGNKKSCGCLGIYKNGERKCSICKNFLSINNFAKNASACKKCSSARRKEIYNPKRIHDTYVRNLTEEKRKTRNKYARERRNLNPEFYNNKLKEWRRSNPNYKKDKWKNDKEFRIKEILRGRLYKAIKGQIKYDSAINLLGCTVEKLYLHLESMFQEGMSWDNYGKWHIDHIKPCAVFDFNLEEDQRSCFHYTNLQPLWEIDNLKKGKKYEQKNS